MLTKNFYKVMIKSVNILGSVAQIITHEGVEHDVSDPNYMFNGLKYVRCEAVTQGLFGTYFGTGTTPPTMDDYCLESPITDGTLTSADVAPKYDWTSTDHVSLYATHEVTNNGTSDVTITEVGVFGAQSKTGYTFLIDRTVLSTPVTIPAGETKSIYFEVRFDFPAA